MALACLVLPIIVFLVPNHDCYDILTARLSPSAETLANGDKRIIRRTVYYIPKYSSKQISGDIKDTNTPEVQLERSSTKPDWFLNAFQSEETPAIIKKFRFPNSNSNDDVSDLISTIQQRESNLGASKNNSEGQKKRIYKAKWTITPRITENLDKDLSKVLKNNSIISNKITYQINDKINSTADLPESNVNNLPVTNSNGNFLTLDSEIKPVDNKKKEDEVTTINNSVSSEGLSMTPLDDVNMKNESEKTDNIEFSNNVEGSLNPNQNNIITNKIWPQLTVEETYKSGKSGEVDDDDEDNNDESETNIENHVIIPRYITYDDSADLHGDFNHKIPVITPFRNYVALSKYFQEINNMRPEERGYKDVQYVQALIGVIERINNVNKYNVKYASELIHILNNILESHNYIKIPAAIQNHILNLVNNASKCSSEDFLLYLLVANRPPKKNKNLKKIRKHPKQYEEDKKNPMKDSQSDQSEHTEEWRDFLLRLKKEKTLPWSYPNYNYYNALHKPSTFKPPSTTPINLRNVYSSTIKNNLASNPKVYPFDYELPDFENTSPDSMGLLENDTNFNPNYINGPPWWQVIMPKYDYSTKPDEENQEDLYSYVFTERPDAYPFLQPYTNYPDFPHYPKDKKKTRQENSPWFEDEFEPLMSKPLSLALVTEPNINNYPKDNLVSDTRPKTETPQENAPWSEDDDWLQNQQPTTKSFIRPHPDFPHHNPKDKKKTNQFLKPYSWSMTPMIEDNSDSFSSKPLSSEMSTEPNINYYSKDKKKKGPISLSQKPQKKPLWSDDDDWFDQDQRPNTYPSIIPYTVFSNDLPKEKKKKNLLRPLASKPLLPWTKTKLNDDYYTTPGGGSVEDLNSYSQTEDQDPDINNFLRPYPDYSDYPHYPPHIPKGKKEKNLNSLWNTFQNTPWSQNDFKPYGFKPLLPWKNTEQNDDYSTMPVETDWRPTQDQGPDTRPYSNLYPSSTESGLEDFAPLWSNPIKSGKVTKQNIEYDPKEKKEKNPTSHWQSPKQYAPWSADNFGPLYLKPIFPKKITKPNDYYFTTPDKGSQKDLIPNRPTKYQVPKRYPFLKPYPDYPDFSHYQPKYKIKKDPISKWLIPQNDLESLRSKPYLTSPPNPNKGIYNEFIKDRTNSTPFKLLSDQIKNKRVPLKASLDPTAEKKLKKNIWREPANSYDKKRSNWFWPFKKSKTLPQWFDPYFSNEQNLVLNPEDSKNKDNGETERQDSYVILSNEKIPYYPHNDLLSPTDTFQNYPNYLMPMATRPSYELNEETVPNYSHDNDETYPNYLIPSMIGNEPNYPNYLGPTMSPQEYADDHFFPDYFLSDIKKPPYSKIPNHDPHDLESAVDNPPYDFDSDVPYDYITSLPKAQFIEPAQHWNAILANHLLRTNEGTDTDTGEVEADEFYYSDNYDESDNPLMYISDPLEALHPVSKGNIEELNKKLLSEMKDDANDSVLSYVQRFLKNYNLDQHTIDYFASQVNELFLKNRKSCVADTLRGVQKFLQLKLMYLADSKKPRFINYYNYYER